MHHVRDERPDRPWRRAVVIVGVVLTGWMLTSAAGAFAANGADAPVTEATTMVPTSAADSGGVQTTTPPSTSAPASTTPPTTKAPATTTTTAAPNPVTGGVTEPPVANDPVTPQIDAPGSGVVMPSHGAPAYSSATAVGTPMVITRSAPPPAVVEGVQVSGPNAPADTGDVAPVSNVAQPAADNNTANGKEIALKYPQPVQTPASSDSSSISMLLIGLFALVVVLTGASAALFHRFGSVGTHGGSGPATLLPIRSITFASARNAVISKVQAFKSSMPFTSKSTVPLTTAGPVTVTVPVAAAELPVGQTSLDGNPAS